MSTYEVFKATKAKAEKAHNEALAELIAVSGTEKGPMGMTPDHIKATPEWKMAYKMERAMFETMRIVNGYGAKHFKREMRDDRNAKRDATNKVMAND